MLGSAGLPMDLAASHVERMYFSVQMQGKGIAPFSMESKFTHVVFEIYPFLNAVGPAFPHKAGR